MFFKDEEVEKMQAIFRRLEPRTIDCLQIFVKDNNLRTGCTIVIRNKWKQPICIFQNFEHLSPYRMKLLMRLADKITYPIHITKPREDILTIGWKVETKKPLS